MIKLKGISKRYDSSVIFENLSYEFKDNGFYFLLGKSGSGKTTLLNLLGNLEVCTDGNIERDADVCYVFQEANLLTDFTVYENIKITGIEDEEIDTILESLQILDLKHKVIHILSGGEKQRVAIGRALAMGGEILLLDEPTGNLDEQNTNQILNILKEISKTRLVIMATHDTSIVEKYGDVILEIKDRTLLEKIQSLPIVSEQKKQGIDSKKLFSFKFQFLYAMKLVKSRPLKYTITVLLSMLSMLLLFLILNIMFFNENHVVQNAIKTDERKLYSITKEYYNEPTNESLNYTYGSKLEEELSLAVAKENYSYYKKITFPTVSYDTQTEFQFIILNETFEGVYITDFVSNYLFSSQDCIGKKINVGIDGSISQFEIMGLKDTNYSKVYDLYFSDGKYMSHHKDDFLFYYGVVYISLNTYRDLLLSEPLKLTGTNFTLNHLDLRNYMNSYYEMAFESDDDLIENQVKVSKSFYDTYMDHTPLPASYTVRDIEDTINKNLYINRLNLHSILTDVNVVGIDDTLESDISVSLEVFDKLVEEYLHYVVDGICLDDTLKVQKLHQYGFKIANEDIGKAYFLNEILSNVLKIAILVVCLIIAAISILALYFSIAVFMDKKAKEFFIMKCLDISKGRILNIFIIYTAFVICIGLIFVLLFGNICIALFNEYLKNEVFFINYRLFIFQYEPYLLLLGLVVLTGIFILLNPMLSLKKIDIATLVKLNN